MAACDAVGDVTQYVAALQLGQPTRYWLVLDGKRYPSKAIVRDALARRGSDWLPGGGECKTALESLGFVVIDWPELNRARDAFLRQMADFTDFRAAAGSYWDVERAYKNGLIEQAKEIIARQDDDPAVGESLYRLLSVGGSGLPLSWRTLSEVHNADPELRDRLYTALGLLARSDAPLDEAIPAAARELEALREAGIAGLRRGEVLSIPITVWATLHPEQASWFKIAKIDEMGRRLFGRRLFPQTEFREADLAEWLQLMRALFGLLDKEFGWHPQDLFDVQGFIWVVWQDRQEDGVSEMEDNDVLAKFDSDPRFKAARENWEEAEAAAFCNIARAVHDAQLDWFVVRGPSTSLLRFGLRNQDAVSAEGVLGYVNPGQNHVHLNDRYGILPAISGHFSAIDISALIEAIRPAQQHVATWKRFPDGRPAYWPSDYAAPAVSGPEVRVGKPSKPTNLILYGPPGTGKTYLTAREAVRLCGEVVPDDRDALMELYERLSEDGRIRFVTFHQSFSYEEFVEGLRPSTAAIENAGDDATGGGFHLRVEDGIFKKISSAALADTGDEGSSGLLDRSRQIVRLGVTGHNWAEQLDRAIDQGSAGWPHGGDHDWSAPEFESWEAIKELRKRNEPELLGNNPKIYGTWLFRSMEVGDYVLLTVGRDKVHAIGRVTGDYEYHPEAVEGSARHLRVVEWLWHDKEGVVRDTIYPTPFTSFHTAYPLDAESIKWDALNSLAFGDDAVARAAAARRPYVLIIDEINRGNVSKIFGELITLIEPDKRLGQPNRLRVTLPYSNLKFGVPDNLHIIGTMNTADRSIALLDTALRRRFRFEEMAPNTSIPAFTAAENSTGLPLGDVLNTMNRRIEYLIDRDHRIGHAFFIDCKTKADADAVMRDKVIPLLQEYFFDDWNRLAAVLGEKDKGGNFLTCDVIEDPMGEGGDPLKSWRVRSHFDEGAYTRLISARAASASDMDDEA